MIEYGAVIYHAGLTQKQSAELEAIQRRALCIIRGRDASVDNSMSSLCERRHSACQELFSQMCDSQHRLHHLLPPPHTKQYNLRKQRIFSSSNLRTATNRFNSEFVNYCINNFNSV